MFDPAFGLELLHGLMPGRGLQLFDGCRKMHHHAVEVIGPDLLEGLMRSFEDVLFCDLPLQQYLGGDEELLPVPALDGVSNDLVMAGILLGRIDIVDAGIQGGG